MRARTKQKLSAKVADGVVQEFLPAKKSKRRPEILPAMVMADVVLFPEQTMPFVNKNCEAILKKTFRSKSAGVRAKQVCVLFPEETSTSDGLNFTSESSFHNYAVVGELISALQLPDGTTGFTLRGVEVVQLKAVVLEAKNLFAEFYSRNLRHIPTLRWVRKGHRRFSKSLYINQFKSFIRSHKGLAEEYKFKIDQCSDLSRLCDMIVPNLTLSRADQLNYLEVDRLTQKCKLVQQWIQQERNFQKLNRSIKNDVVNDLEDMQKKFFLREQIKAFKRELGEYDDEDQALMEIEEQVAKIKLPRAAEEAFKEEVQKIKSIPTGTPEYGVAFQYLSLIRDLPWNIDSVKAPSMRRAIKILDKAHVGISKPKQRVLEYIGLLNFGSKIPPTILALVGPPGVGKTSFAKSIADAIGRPFVKISLAGVKDEAEIRGHRRTYVASMPGRIIQGIKQCGSRSCVMLLDEFDKAGTSESQSVQSSLLELLDPAQNCRFLDHYLAIEFDLSSVVFIVTANDISSLHPALRDRLDIIEIPSYTETEKVDIIQKKILPAMCKDAGLSARYLKISDQMIRTLIRSYTRESGVRELQRLVDSLIRKRIMHMLAKSKTTFQTNSKDFLQKMLGPPKYLEDSRVPKMLPGIVSGLAYTDHGGEILLVEVALRSCSDAKNSLQITGSLGNVMRESVMAACTHLASITLMDGLKFKPENFHVHVHAPDGGTPKDGPSAGVAIFLALTSSLISKPIHPDLAITGEISLHGQVLPVGGIREKLMAAYREGRKRVLIPATNIHDAAELPSEVRSEIDIIPIHTAVEALKICGFI